MPDTFNMVNAQTGETRAVPSDAVAAALDQGFHYESDAEQYAQAAHDRRFDALDGPVGTAIAGVSAVGRGVTAGGSDLLLRGIGLGDTAADAREAHPYVSAGGEILGSLAGIGPAGAITKLGTRIAKTAEGASVATKLGRSALGGTTEGALFGAGQGVTEAALSEDPLTVERLASSVSSNALFGGVVGGVAGTAGKGIELGLGRAKRALTEYAAKGAAGKVDDAAAIAERTTIVDDLGAFRRETKEAKLFLPTKGIKEETAAIKGGLKTQEIGSISLKADRTLDTLLKNPKDLADNLKPALKALRAQEHAWENLIKRTDDLKLRFAADTSGERVAALEAVPAALEKNRAIQARLVELTKPTAAAGGLAHDVGNMGHQMVQGSVFGGVMGLAAPILGGALALPVAALAAKGIAGAVFGKMGKAAAGVAERSSRAVGALLNVAEKVAPSAPVLATKVLSNLRYAPPAVTKTEPAPRRGKPQLAQVYKERTGEIKSLVSFGPDGKPAIRPAARRRVAANLAGIRAVQPLLADRLETHAVRQLEFLAGKVPRRPDLGVLQTGPDTWQPSDMAMRTFARYAAAVEDPGGIEERLASGAITPEDGEVMREVFPERFADITRQILEQLPTLQRTLPYQRRLALSIFSGAPVDAAMHPQVLRVLQGSFAEEDGTEGGVQAPTATPQFGSVKSADTQATPAQQRGA